MALVPATPPPNTQPVGGDNTTRRAQGDPTARALALIKKALNTKPAAEAGTEAKAASKDTKDAPVPQPVPVPSGSKPQRGAGAKTVKGPILL